VLRERYTEGVEVLASTDTSQPLVFIGPPESLTGTLRLQNPGADRAVLRRAAFHGDAVHGEARFSARLQPGESRAVEIEATLGPHAPPGEHRVEVEIAGRRYPAVVQVSEVIDLEIEPSPIVLEHPAAGRVTKTVILRNAGNVALMIGEIGPVPLDEELLSCRTGREALADLGDEASLDGYVAAVLRATKAAVAESGLLRVHNTRGSFELGPGDVVPLSLQITVPAKLHAGARYTGVVPMFTSDLSFLLVPAPKVRAATTRQTKEA
jgi:hypothetical protein